jgi:hypothetical protein
MLGTHDLIRDSRSPNGMGSTHSEVDGWMTFGAMQFMYDKAAPHLTRTHKRKAWCQRRCEHRAGFLIRPPSARCT